MYNTVISLQVNLYYQISLFIESLINLYNDLINSDLAISLDYLREYQMRFQEPATPIMEGIIDFHHDIMFYLFIVAGVVFWMLGATIYFFGIAKKSPMFFSHHVSLEIIWTIIPAIILMLIAVPSFALLYAIDELINPLMTLKVVGHQWYWNYQYADFATKRSEILLFDSYMIKDDELALGYERLLETDFRVIVPSRIHLRILITSTDVLHSWAVPSLGVKLDACPGRLNETNAFIKRNGLFFGQCSEICGINHGFMPIALHAIPTNYYLIWIGINTCYPDFNEYYSSVISNKIAT